MTYKVIYFLVGGQRFVVYEGSAKGKASLALVEATKHQDIQRAICVPGREMEKVENNATNLCAVH